MKMITDSLEKVYTAMGGADEFDKTDIANGIEQISEVAGSGGGGSGLVVNLSGTPSPTQGWVILTLDKTYAEIAQALDNGIMPVVVGEEFGNPIKTIFRIQQYGYVILEEDPEYLVALDIDGGTNFSCTSVDGYPTTEKAVG